LLVFSSGIGVLACTGQTTYNLNQALVRSGYAWWYRKYSPNDSTLRQLEAEARAKKIGIWSEAKQVIAPWDWRKGVRPDAPRPP
jgi:endonuclease YncB( thermonuclease family)